MKKTSLIIVILCSLISNLNAQNQWSFKAGINYSNFRDEEDALPKLGYSLGINREWTISTNTVIAAEFIYTTKGGILKNKTIAPEEAFSHDIHFYDIHCKVGYIELPILIKYFFQINQDIKLIFYGGFSFSVPIIDYSEIKKGKFLYYYDENNDKHKMKDFDYNNFGEPTSEILYKKYYGFNSEVCINYGPNLGIGFKWLKFSVELRYARDNLKFGYAGTIGMIQKHTHSFNLLFSIRL